MNKQQQHAPRTSQKTERVVDHFLVDVASEKTRPLLRELKEEFGIITIEQIVAQEISEPNSLLRHFSKTLAQLKTLLSECAAVVDMDKLRTALNQPTPTVASNGSILWGTAKLPPKKGT